MAQLNTRIDDDLDKKLRKAVSNRLGVRHGSMNKAIIEAINDWIDKPKHQEKEIIPELKYELIKVIRPSHKNDPSKGGVLSTPKEFIGWKVGINKIEKINEAELK